MTVSETTLLEIEPDKIEARVKGEPAEVEISKVDYTFEMSNHCVIIFKR